MFSGTAVVKIAPEIPLSSPESTQPDILELSLNKDSTKTRSHDFPPVIAQEKTGGKMSYTSTQCGGGGPTLREELHQNHNGVPKMYNHTSNTYNGVPKMYNHTSNTYNAYNKAAVENSSQSTTSSGGGSGGVGAGGAGHRGISSGPGVLSLRKNRQSHPKAATISDPVTKKERKMVGQMQNGSIHDGGGVSKSSPKKITIDLDRYDVFNKKSGMAGMARSITTPGVSTEWNSKKGQYQYAYQGFSRARTIGARSCLKKASSRDGSTTQSPDACNNLAPISINGGVPHRPNGVQNGFQRVTIGGVTTTKLGVGKAKEPTRDIQVTFDTSDESNSSTNWDSKVVFPAISPPLVSARAQAELQE